MSPEPPPSLPFAEFKWRWASAQPTEGLNDPDVYLGVLRALHANEGNLKSGVQLHSDLLALETQLGPLGGLRLARPPDRNLIRNSGQYWSALGLIENTSAVIALTTLGRRFADRDVTQTEFALHVVANFTLPSSVYPDTERAQWAAAGITFRPLLLVLEIISRLATLSSVEGELSEDELVRIVQPMSAVTQDPDRIAKAIVDYRHGILSLNGWPAVANRVNDKRMSDEFLLFLANYGLLTATRYTPSNRVYRLLPGAQDVVLTISGLASSSSLGTAAIDPAVRVESQEFERRRTSREVWDRPGQKKFRDDVMNAAGGVCALTRTAVGAVLEAAHIRPVSRQGSDLVGNGLCLRADIHVLYDSNRVRIDPSGALHCVAEVTADPAYSGLPAAIAIPTYVDLDQVSWRWSFT